MLERDPELLEQLEGYELKPFRASAYRVAWEGRNPFQGSSGKRGRWNSPEGQFEILNMCLVSEGADAEFSAFWSLFEQRPEKPAQNHELEVELQKVVELSADDLARLGVDMAEFGSRNYSRTQEIADALNYLGCDGLIVPSPRHDGRNLVVFMQNVAKDCKMELKCSRAFKWPD
ncbi:MAG TPA: hypothetical protein DCG48_07525 [Rhodospirillaceae bacterium]|nr:hypothetical protein [Rhodospirillaceae bacterium]|tara:strand:- start:7784 stop:8305 length:522 start_codon:yes stop_codon:yes gene_type:complete